METFIEAIYHTITYPIYILGKLLQTVILLPVYIIAAIKGSEIHIENKERCQDK